MLILVGYLFTILKGHRMKKTVILTDAGINTESGLKTFVFLLVLIKIELMEKLFKISCLNHRNPLRQIKL